MARRPTESARLAPFSRNDRGRVAHPHRRKIGRPLCSQAALCFTVVESRPFRGRTLFGGLPRYATRRRGRVGDGSRGELQDGARGAELGWSSSSATGPCARDAWSARSAMRASSCITSAGDAPPSRTGTSRRRRAARRGRAANRPRPHAAGRAPTRGTANARRSRRSARRPSPSAWRRTLIGEAKDVGTAPRASMPRWTPPSHVRRTSPRPRRCDEHTIASGSSWEARRRGRSGAPTRRRLHAGRVEPRAGARSGTRNTKRAPRSGCGS